MRNIHPDLLDCLRRPNPYTELVTEISAPDVSDVLRRPDQFTGPKQVSQTPAASLAVSSRGPLQIASASTNIATFTGEGGAGDPFYLNREDANRRLKGVGWELDKDFVRAVLRTVTVKIYRNLAPSGVDFELQIFRVTRTPGLKYKPNSTTGTPWNEYVFTPLLTPAAVIKWASIVWAADKATLAFDLTNHGLIIENTPEQAVSPDQVGELPKYYIVVRPVNMSKAMDRFGWYVDGATAQTVAGVGTFKRVYWARNSDQEQWSEDIKPGTPNITVAVEQFQAAAEAVYSLDLTRAPAAGTTGRVMFERLLPPNTAASVAISTAGSGGPWTAIKHGDVVALAQQTYHLKLTLASDAARRSSPGVTALGIEFRKTYDVTAESILELPTREISLPWLEASIAEAKIRVLRLGVRDYLDVASTIGATESASKLEVDIYLASRHPSITRDKWLRLERMLVTNRTPSPNAEDFTLLSYASRLKKKIPEKKETISSVHVVAAGSTAAQLILGSALPGASAGGNEYDNKRYYIRVQKTAVADFAPGHVQEIAGNTGVDRLDFSPALPGVLAAGDVVEVHSGVYNTQVITWQDADFADIWWELLTAYEGVPPERIGHGSLPRGGLPPKVTDRAPGNAAAQAKLKGTFRLAEQESGDEPLDQVSFHLGGATVEIDGQICFVQIYELRDPTGVVTVPLPAVSRVFDLRDYSGLTAAPGLEKRATVLSAQYGKNAAAANPDSFPEKTTVVVDNDAFAWLARTDLDDLGTTELPEKIRRWIYNSSDTGLQLATDEAHRVVRATSTGLRVWPFTLGEPHPELTIGDVVVIVTDQYTDYDPASVTPLRGWLAVRGVVVRCGGAGRQLGIFVPGLTDNVTAIKGGLTGDITSLGDAPEKPTVTVGFNASGQATINIDGRDRTASMKVEVEKIATPTDVEVEATTAIEGAGASVSILSPTWAPGEVLYGKAFAYAGSGGTGRRSESTVFTLPREGTGQAAAPFVYIIPVLASRSQTSETLRISGEVNSGGTEPLEYRYRIDDGAWSAWAALGSSGSSVDLVIAKGDFYDKMLAVQVRDGGAVESDVATWTVIGEYELVETGTGRLRPTVPMYSTGALPFGRGYDVASDVVELASRKFAHGDFLDASRNIVSVYRGGVVESAGNLFKRGSDTAGDIVATGLRTFIEPNFVDASLRPVNVYRGGASESVGNLFKRGSDTAADIVEIAGRNFIEGGMIDGSRRVVNVYRAAATEPVGNLFKRGSDTATDVLTTSARSYVDPALVDPSFRVTSVYRSGVNEPVNNLLKAGDAITDASLSSNIARLNTAQTWSAGQAFIFGSSAEAIALRNTSSASGYVGIKFGDDLSDVNSTIRQFTRGHASKPGFMQIGTETDTSLALQTWGVHRLLITGAGVGTLYGVWTTTGKHEVLGAWGVMKSLLLSNDGTEANYRHQLYLDGNNFLWYSRGYGDVIRINYTGGGTLYGAWSVTGTATLVYTDISHGGANIARFNSTHASGGYTLWSRSGVAVGYAGGSDQLWGDGALDDFEVRSNASLYLTAPTNIYIKPDSTGTVHIGRTNGGTLYGPWTTTGTFTISSGELFVSAGNLVTNEVLLFRAAGVNKWYLGRSGTSFAWYSYDAGRETLTLDYAGGLILRASATGSPYFNFNQEGNGRIQFGYANGSSTFYIHSYAYGDAVLRINNTAAGGGALYGSWSTSGNHTASDFILS